MKKYLLQQPALKLGQIIAAKLSGRNQGQTFEAYNSAVFSNMQGERKKRKLFCSTKQDP